MKDYERQAGVTFEISEQMLDAGADALALQGVDDITLQPKYYQREIAREVFEAMMKKALSSSKKYPSEEGQVDEQGVHISSMAEND